jgi:hypothetical protein
VGLEDEAWWSRLAQPSLYGWSEEGKPPRLVQQSVAKDDPDPKALSSCYGLFLPELERRWLRFVDGRPVSGITTRFLSWCCEKLEAIGKKVLVLIWENAPWHVSKEVRRAGSGGTTGGFEEERLWGQDHKLSAAQAESVAEPDRAQEVGARQAQGGGSRWVARCPRAGRARLRGFRVSALRASLPSRKGRLMVH